jgi:hypothetical protein
MNNNSQEKVIEPLEHHHSCHYISQLYTHEVGNTA